MSNKKNQYIKNMGHEGGSGTMSYYRNKCLIMSGETLRSQKRRGPEKAPSRYKSRF